MQIGIDKQGAGSDTDQRHLIINFRVGNRDYEEDVGLLLRLDFREAGYNELDEQLEKLSYWRVLFSVAYAQAKESKEELEKEKEIWEWKQLDRAEGFLRLERVDEMKSGLRSQIGQITAQQLKSWMLADEDREREYREMGKGIRDFKKQEEVLKSVRDSMVDRAIALMAIAKRRWEERVADYHVNG